MIAHCFTVSERSCKSQKRSLYLFAKNSECFKRFFIALARSVVIAAKGKCPRFVRRELFALYFPLYNIVFEQIAFIARNTAVIRFYVFYYVATQKTSSYAGISRINELYYPAFVYIRTARNIIRYSGFFKLGVKNSVIIFRIAHDNSHVAIADARSYAFRYVNGNGFGFLIFVSALRNRDMLRSFSVFRRIVF